MTTQWYIFIKTCRTVHLKWWILLYINYNKKWGREKTWRMHLDVQVGAQAVRRGSIWPRNGVPSPGDPLVTHRSPWASCPLVSQGYNQALEVMSAPSCGSSPPTPAHVWFFTPHLPAMASLLPKSTPTGLSGLGWLSRKWGEGFGPWPFRCHLCLPPSISASSSPPGLLLGAPNIFPFVIKSYTLRYGYLTVHSETAVKSKERKRTVGLFPAPFHRSSPTQVLSRARAFFS